MCLMGKPAVHSLDKRSLTHHSYYCITVDIKQKKAISSHHSRHNNTLAMHSHRNTPQMAAVVKRNPTVRQKNPRYTVNHVKGFQSRVWNCLINSLRLRPIGRSVCMEVEECCNHLKIKSNSSEYHFFSSLGLFYYKTLSHNI